jgi:hypothetical protein
MQQRMTSDFDRSRLATAPFSQAANSSHDLKLCRVSFFPLINRLISNQVDLSTQTDIKLIARGPAAIRALCQLGEHFIEGTADGVGDTLSYANGFYFSRDRLLHCLRANTNLASDGCHGYFGPALPQL